MRVIRQLWAEFARRPCALLLSIGLAAGAMPLAHGQASVLTHHNDNARSGANLGEATLNTTNVNVATFGRLFSYPVDADVFTQPLYLPAVNIAGKGLHKVVYVATQNDSVYAFDAETNTGASATPLWQVNFTNPAAGITTVPVDEVTTDSASGNLRRPGPIGIMGTPVIDPGTGTMYLVARTKENGAYVQRLHALDVTSGAEKFGGPVLIQASVAGSGAGTSGGRITFDPRIQNQRAGLVFDHGVVYIAWASHDDSYGYHGWVMGYDAATLQQTGVFNVTPDGSWGGIWQSGQAPATDADGNLYMLTGNGSFTTPGGGRDVSQSFIKLRSRDLALLDWFTQCDVDYWNSIDADLASGGVLKIPNLPRVFGGGKEGRFFLLDTANLGKIQQYGATNCSNPQVVQTFQATAGGHIHGSPVYYESPTRGPLVYVWGEADRLKAFAFNGTTFNPTPIAQSPFTAPPGMPGGFMSVSANGSQPGSGILWVTMPLDKDAENAVVSGVVRAFDASDVSVELWNSRQNPVRDDIGNFAKYTPATVADGRVYVPTFSNELVVYGLNPPAPTGIRFVQAAAATPQSSTSSLAIPYGAAQIAGDMNVVIIGWSDTTSTVASVTDSAGNSYRLATGPVRGNGISQAMYYAPNIRAGTNTVTVTFSQPAPFPDVRVLEYFGLDTTNPLDVAGGAAGNGSVSSSGPLTTGAASELIVSGNYVLSYTTQSVAPFVARIITAPDADIAEDLVTTATGTYTATATLSVAAGWVMQAAAFKAASSTAPHPSVITPTSGPTGGGQSVSISGTNFAAGATVLLGGAAASNVVLADAGSITATTPAHAAGAVDLVITNPDGQTGALTGAYVYQAPPPTDTAVLPSTGPTNGGTVITINGTNFLPGATVTLGGLAASNVVVGGSTSLSAVAPAHAAGAVDVVVTNPDGQSATLPGGYTYVAAAAPLLAGIAPASGPTTGGTAVTLSGANFAAGAGVTFGGTAATGVVVTSTGSITATAPGHAAGAVAVVVTNPDGQSATLPGGYTYVAAPAPTVTSASPVSGPAAGGTVVTLSGSNFAGGATVSFGGTAASNVVVATATALSATAPAHAAGAVNVVVTNPDGQSGTLAAGYTYAAAAQPIAFVQVAAATPQSATQNVSVALATAQAAGNLNVVIIGWNDASSTIQSVTDSAGNSYRLATGPLRGTGISQAVYYASGIRAGANTVTVSFASAVAYPDLRVLEYAGLDAAAPLDNAVGAAGSTATSSSGALSTATANELLVAGNYVMTATSQAVAPFVARIITTPDADIAQDSVAGTVGSYTASASLSSAGAWVMQMAAFKAAAGTAPTLSAITPASGSTAGGTAITLTGSRFAAGATVSVGGTPASNVVVASATSITATTPAHAAGTVNVVVTNPDGQSATLAAAFTFVAPPPGVASVAPTSGVATGATPVTISGSNFVAGARVSFGGTAATSVTVSSASTITALTPAHAAGSVDVVVVNPDGQTATLAGGYTYVPAPAPTLISLAPTSGPATGGTTVSLTGSNFSSGATVSFGGTAATNVVVASSTSISATAPAHAAGAVNVVVTNADGQSGTLAGGYSYIAAPAPTLTGVAPASGSTAGGTSVGLTGTNFASGATVSFGSAAASNVVVASSTSITATVPAHAAGAVNVVVTNPDGQSDTRTAGYTYVAPAPTLTGVAPASGPLAGGTAVTLTGTNFASGASVSFGGTAATNVVVASATSITATAPAHAAGAISVVVTNPDGQAASLVSGYTYTSTPPPIAFVQVAASTPQSPTSTVSAIYTKAQTAGNLNVVIIGWNDATSTIQNVTDSVGNTYRLAGTVVRGTNVSQAIYYAAGIRAGSNAVTVTFGAAAPFPDLRILEYQGVSTLDVAVGASGNSATSSSGAATTTTANELLIGANYVITATRSAGSGFTSRIITAPDADIAEDRIVTTAGSYSATATLSSGGRWVMQMVGFR